MGSKEDAENLTQELFSRILMWIYKIGHNLAVDFKHKRKPSLSFNGENKKKQIVKYKAENNEYGKIVNFLEQLQIQEKIKTSLLKLSKNQK